MNRKMKILIATPLVIIGLVVLVVGGFVAYSIATSHPDPRAIIGNYFDQPVTVYFEGHKMGKVNSGESKTFYPNEVLTPMGSDLLVELKSNSGTTLYSKQYTYDEFLAVFVRINGSSYWIGN